MSESEESSEAETAEEAKPKARRKPVYVCIPIAAKPVTFLDDDGFERTVYTIPEHVAKFTTASGLYAVTRCEGGKGQTDAVRDVLAQQEIDPTNYDGVMMFRADPMKFKIGQQLFVRF